MTLVSLHCAQPAAFGIAATRRETQRIVRIGPSASLRLHYA
jgi:hypothetical protein